MNREHLVELDAGWRLWRLAAARSAGLPFDTLAPLADGDSRAAMHALLRDDGLLTALTWQNPDVVDNWVADYVAELRAGQPRARGEMRRRETLVARYAQRYCAKNDTIGHFGPVAWARWGPGPTGRTGTLGVRRGAVYVETWAVESIARRWNTDPALREHLPVRLDPSCVVADGEIRRPHRRPIPVDGARAKVVAALREVQRVGDVVARCGPASADVLTGLAEDRVIQVGFLVPLDSRPELHLRAQVEKITAPAVRDRLLADLDALDSAVADVPVGPCSPDRLRHALAGVDARLAELAGGAVRPGSGLAAGGRTPVYADCRRDLDVVLGEDLLDGLATPLGVLLDSARWLAGQVGETIETALRQRFVELAARVGEVTLADLQFVAADLLDPAANALADIRTDFQLRWAEILPATETDVPVDMPVDIARRLADTLFPATGTLWAAARLHSPDLMLRDAPPGAPRWVLGELHVGLNTLENRFFRTQADDPDELVAAVAADVARGRVVPVYPNTSREVSSRTYPPLCLDPPGRYRYWSYGSDHGVTSGAPSTPATALVVSEQDGRLVATSTADGWAAPVLECFGEFLSALVVNLFRLRAPSPYAPRVTMGDLVVCRRTWTVPFADLGADVTVERLVDRARELGLARHAFVRTLAGTKPFYVDFAAPALVDNLARSVRRAVRSAPGERLEVVEMLPAPDELWLRDAAGRRYTSELRMVAVDPAGHPAASWLLG
jgi:lantibiotic biosynthesis dehydratase-like protein